MPAPNDLTPEEEAEFAQHGVPSAGPGREPLGDAPPQQQQQQQSQEQQEADDQGGRQTFHRQDGRFASREEVQAGQAKPSGQQQQQDEQQGEPQGGQQQSEQQSQEGEQVGERRMVPLEALHESRQRAAAIARRAQLAETRLNAILSRQQPQGEQQQMPDINTDPAGYIVALEQRVQQFEAERTENLQNQQVDQSISADEEVFTSMRPDYPQASDYFVQSRAAELLAFHTPQEAQRMMLAEARQIARAAWERGKSVGEVIYGLAQARGYNPGMPQREPAPQQQQQQQQQQQGQPPQQQQGGPSAQEVIASVTRGQQASRSLSGGTGASPANLNASALLEMDDAEFDKWLGQGSDANKRFAAIG